jgi:hypothetical protein
VIRSVARWRRGYVSTSGDVDKTLLITHRENMNFLDFSVVLIGDKSQRSAQRERSNSLH